MVFRNIPSSTLSRVFKIGSVFYFAAIYPIYNPKVYKKSSLNEKRIDDVLAEHLFINYEKILCCWKRKIEKYLTDM